MLLHRTLPPIIGVADRVLGDISCVLRDLTSDHNTCGWKLVSGGGSLYLVAAGWGEGSDIGELSDPRTRYTDFTTGWFIWVATKSNIRYPWITKCQNSFFTNFSVFPDT